MDWGPVWLAAGYSLVVAFSLAERALRRGPEAKAFARGRFDRGSTALTGASFALALVIPLVLDYLGEGLVSIGIVAGLVALAVSTAGVALRLWAASVLGEHYTRTLQATGDQSLVMEGPYRMVRHPGYLGSILMWTGFGVLTGNLIVALLLPPLFISTYLYRMATEEEMLLQVLGNQYAQYKSKTKKLVPLLY